MPGPGVTRLAPLRVALLGAGFIGGVHAASLAGHPDVDFALVYDVDAARAEDLAARHGTRAVTTVEAAFDPQVVDSVLIASATDTHSEHLRRATDAGLAAFCEKPVDLDLSAAIETVAYAEAGGLKAMVDFNRRFDRDYAELRRAVVDGEVGAVELVQLSTRGPAVPPLSYVAVSGGQMRDQTVHFFDLALWITGLRAVEVYVAGGALAEPRLADYGDIDTSVATLVLEGGTLVQIDSIRRSGYGYDERIEVFGSEGMVEARRHRVGAVARYRPGAVVQDGLPEGWFERVRPTYAAALDHFVRSLSSGTPLEPSLQDGLRAQEVAEAATRSLTTGRPEGIGRR